MKTIYLTSDLSEFSGRPKTVVRFAGHTIDTPDDMLIREQMRNRFVLTIETGAAAIDVRPTVQQARNLAGVLTRLADQVEADEGAALARAMGVAA